MKIQDHTSEVTDQCICVTSEVLTCIKLIKMYTWERPFAEMIKGMQSLVFCSEPGDAMTFEEFFHALENSQILAFGAFLFF